MKSTAMRKTPIFSAVLSLFLLVPASIIWAQTVTQQKGLTTTVFNLPQGIIKVYLPDDIRSGDMISGSIVLEPSGANEKQRQRALEELLKNKLTIGDPTSSKDPLQPLSQLYQPGSTVSPLGKITVSPQCVISLIDANNKTISVAIQVKPVQPGTTTPSSGCSWPSHALIGSPVAIRGSFDGDMSTTKCTIGAQTATILAESPGTCIVSFPENAKGIQTTQLTEKGQEPCTRQIAAVDLQVTTGKLNLRKGENTFIDVKVTGLENLPDKAVLTITNLTPQVVTMTKGNVQVIPIWPPSDTAHGTFTVNCPAVSTATGNFTVSINLDLPEANAAATPSTEIPPGYIKKSCECSATATVTKTGNTFKAEAKGECKGQYGIGINTFPRCAVQTIAYGWSVTAGKENAGITGPANTASVSVRPKKNGNYIVCVTITVICVDGTVCTTVVCANQSGQQVDSPGTEARPPVTTPPVTGDPENPTTTTSSKCQCGCTVMIRETGNVEKDYGFAAEVNAQCKGTFGTGSSRSVCAVLSVTYVWSISSGGEFATIKGAATGAAVTVRREKLKPFVLRVVATTTCNDGTVCTCMADIEVPGVEDKSCSPVVREKMEPAMDGGLKSKQIGLANTSLMPRDEFIALQAEGGDWDQMVFRCVPSKPDCLDEPSEKTIPLVGKVRFEWKIEGDGTFVQLGCLPDERTAEGDRVIFKPAYLPLPVKGADTTITVIIKLLIIDDGSAVMDETKEKIITIRIRRSKSTPDKYSVDITGGTGTAPASPARKENLKTCRTIGPSWEPGDHLTRPQIQKPAIADNDKMVLGQWLLLTADKQDDNDLARFRCTSTNECPTGATQKNYPDKVEWTWEIIKGGGKFITGNSGRVVIYEAATDMTENMREVTIKVTAKNHGGERKDPDKVQEEILIKVYKPGIKLSHPALTWLPEENNSLELRSELLYKDGEWKSALAHMCRIHYFELMNVSEEKGVCLNNPVPKDADQCRDLQMKNEGGHEAFDDAKGTGKCTTKEIYQQARTKRPEQVYTITVHARDFGAWGFLRSFANINKKTSVEGKPVYTSVPVKKTDVTHPQARLKKTEYADNRVTIPHDIDENHIADGGWMATGTVMMTEPGINNEDEDDKPVGDGFKGDGLSAYEEYRGFKTADAGVVAHSRTNYKVKNIFIRNESQLNLNLYTSVSGLDVHEINADQYVDDRIRVINPNFNPTTHTVNQMGLRLIDRVNHSSLLGIAVATTNQPAIPNLEVEIRIYSARIAEVSRRRGLQDKLAEKLQAVTAHELLHGNNVCHHGEQDPAIENSFNLRQGLRSGNTSCVMRYDNVGDVVRGFDPEAIGSDLCDSSTGTGYNANGQGFGNTATKRGNCRGQIRVSGKGTPPRSCGNR